MMTRTMAGLILCGLFALAPVQAEAQGIGGLVKKKVAERTGQDAKATDPTQEGSPYNEVVIEITEPVMTGFMNGLDVEIALLVEFAEQLATYKSPEEFDECSGQALLSEEGQKIMSAMFNIADGATAAEVERTMLRAEREMKAFVTKRCDADPQEVWNVDKRRERLEEIDRKAAAAAGPVRSLRPAPLPPGGPAIDEAAYTGIAQDSGLTVMQYKLSKERVEAYCKALDAGLIQPGKAVFWEGESSDPTNPVYWIYSDAEAQAIAPRCKDVQNKGRVILTIGEAVRKPTGTGKVILTIVGDAIRIK